MGRDGTRPLACRFRRRCICCGYRPTARNSIRWNIWDHLRENYISNRIFASLDAVVNQVCVGLRNLHHQPDLVRSMTCFDCLKTLSLTLN